QVVDESAVLLRIRRHGDIRNLEQQARLRRLDQLQDGLRKDPALVIGREQWLDLDGPLDRLWLDDGAGRLSLENNRFLDRNVDQRLVRQPRRDRPAAQIGRTCEVLEDVASEARRERLVLDDDVPFAIAGQIDLGGVVALLLRDDWLAGS